MELLDPDALAELSALRPNRRPLWIAVAANLTVAIVFLGLPYLHGHLRARASVRAFGSVASCLFGGVPTGEGLSLPRGERLHLAARTYEEADDWPERCRPGLNALVDEETLTVWPDVRGAEAQARRAVALVDRELATFSERRERGLHVLPSRPALAVGRLQAALTILMDEAGMSDPEQEALRFDEDATSVEPARIPVAVRPHAALTMQGRGDGVALAVVGPLRVAQVEVGAGRTLLRWVRRPRLVRGLVPGPDLRWLVWAMDESQCDDGCVHRATGIAPLSLDESRAPAPRWLAGHPLGSVEDSLVLDQDHAHLLARAAGGAAEVRRFALPEAPTEGEPDPAAAPASADRTWPLGVLAGPARLLPDSPPRALALVATEMGSELTLLKLSEASSPSVLASLDSDTSALLACETADGRWLAVVGSTGALLGRLEDERFTVSGEVEFAASDDDATMRFVCDGDRAHLLRASHGSLRAWSITRAAVSEPRIVSEAVGDFDAAREGVTLVAFDAGADGPQVRIRILDDDARPEGPAFAPAGCWEREGGLCGPPTVSASHGRVLVAAWEGSDLRVVETTDAGRSFRTMRGVR